MTYDTSLFDFDGSPASPEITVKETGFYKVTYSATTENANGRSSVLGKIQTNSTGSFTNSTYGGSHLYNRDTNSIFQSKFLSASTILQLNAQDALKIILIDETGRTSTATDYHLDVEYIGTASIADVLRVSDSTGGQTLMIHLL